MSSLIAMRPCTTCQHSEEPGFVPANRTTQTVYNACLALSGEYEHFTVTEIREFLAWPKSHHSKINNALAQLSPRYVKQGLAGNAGFEWSVVGQEN